MKIQIELDDDNIDKIIVASLKYHYKLLGQVKSIPMFSHDEEEEKRLVGKLKKSFKQIIEYYGG